MTDHELERMERWADGLRRLNPTMGARVESMLAEIDRLRAPAAPVHAPAKPAKHQKPTAGTKHRDPFLEWVQEKRHRSKPEALGLLMMIFPLDDGQYESVGRRKRCPRCTKLGWVFLAPPEKTPEGRQIRDWYVVWDGWPEEEESIMFGCTCIDIYSGYRDPTAPLGVWSHNTGCGYDFPNSAWRC